MRRKEIEAEQVALKKKTCLRTRVGGRDYDVDGDEEEYGVIGLEREAEVDVKGGDVGEVKLGESKKAGRDLRELGTIQMRSYALERERYWLRVRGGGVV